MYVVCEFLYRFFVEWQRASLSKLHPSACHPYAGSDFRRFVIVSLSKESAFSIEIISVRMACIVSFFVMVSCKYI